MIEKGAARKQAAKKPAAKKVRPESPCGLINVRIKELGDWRNKTLARVRALNQTRKGKNWSR